MITEDNNHDRVVEEQIAVMSSYTEREIEDYETSMEDHDHRMYITQVDPIVDELEEDLNSRQALTTTASTNMCIRGVQVLVRYRIHVISWLRSSDIDNYRDEDLGFLYKFGCEVRDRMDLDQRLMVHVFTSSLHHEVDDD
mgnify:CR=1 FL=1